MSESKVALITGSGTGVGAAAALNLAGRGYNVVINYSKSEAEAKASEAACKAAGAETVPTAAAWPRPLWPAGGVSMRW
jgi:3-oxoacyl-[acyl-carrier protein] reductase